MALYLGSNEICPTKMSNNTYGWLGPNTEYVGTLYNWNGTMNDTTYASWTPSTSSASILASASGVATYTIDTTQSYVYYLVGGWDNKFTYNSGTTLQKASKHFVSTSILVIFPYPNNYSSYMSGNYTSWTYGTSYPSGYYLEYYNSSGTLAGSQSGYGPAYSTSSISIGSSTSGNNFTLSLSRPSLSARCSTTYFDTTIAPNLNLTSSTLNYRIDIFKQPITECNALYTQIYALNSNKLNNNYSF